MDQPEEPSAAEQMIRSTYTAPSLIGEGDDSMLIDRARELVDDEFPTKGSRKKPGDSTHER